MVEGWSGEKKVSETLLKQKAGVMVHICNPNYVAGGDKKIVF
jgi:hypothetical protein